MRGGVLQSRGPSPYRSKGPGLGLRLDLLVAAGRGGGLTVHHRKVMAVEPRLPRMSGRPPTSYRSGGEQHAGTCGPPARARAKGGPAGSCSSAGLSSNPSRKKMGWPRRVVVRPRGQQQVILGGERRGIRTFEARRHCNTLAMSAVVVVRGKTARTCRSSFDPSQRATRHAGRNVAPDGRGGGGGAAGRRTAAGRGAPRRAPMFFHFLERGVSELRAKEAWSPAGRSPA